MRILELRLLACGPFTDFSLDLSAGDCGLHLIYGPNEAGKSSALRALTYLCFGYPMQLSDDFIHPYPKLRVGARFCNGRGEELDFVRRKANKSSLRSRDDATPVPDEELRRFLGDIDESRFTEFFGINHDMLVKGGREIVEGGGNMGQILFSASGVSDLREVLDGLKKEAEELFMPSARASRKLNHLLSELSDARRAVRDNQLPVREWEDHHRALAIATKRKQAAELELVENTREKSRLDRVGKALPLIASLADLRQKLGQMHEVVLLPADFARRRQKVQEELRAAELEVNRASAKAGQLEQQLDVLAIPRSLIERRAEIEPLAGRLGVYLQAQKDRPGLEAEARQFEEDAIEILRKLGQGLDLVAADALQLPEAKRQRIRNVGQRYIGIVNEVDNWTLKLADLKPLHADTAAAIAQLPPVRDTGPLSSALQDTLRLGNVEEEMSTAQHECESSSNQLAIALKRLQLWSGTIDEVEVIPVPLPETIDRFDKELVQLDDEMKELDCRANEYEKAAGELSQKLNALRLEFDLPTEVDLHAARELREQGWQLVRKTWLAREDFPEDVRGFVAAVGEGNDLAGAYERSVETTDQIADRLRREADRVATHAQLLSQQADCARAIEDLKQQQEAAASRRENKLAEWNQLWQPVCRLPLTPREMQSWARQHSALIQQAQSLRNMRDRVRQLQVRVEERQACLREILAAFGDAPTPARATLEQLVGIARLVLEDAATISQHHRELHTESDRLEKERTRAEEKWTAAKAKLLLWQGEWAEAIADLPIDAKDGPSEANTVLDLMAQLSQQLRHIRDKRRRIAEIDRYAEEFAFDVRTIAEEVAPELKNASIGKLAAELAARLTNAVAAERNRLLLKRQLTEEQEQIGAAGNTIAQMQSQLVALCLEANCASADDLPSAEEKSERRRSLESEIQSLENRLRDSSAGQTLEVLVAEAQSVDGDALEPRVSQLEQEIAQLDHEIKDEIGPAIGAEQTELKKLDSSAMAADAAERVQDLILRISVAAQEYSRLQIALVTLRRGIERYRKQHQGPIIQRSSELFSRLTLGAFSELREDYDTEGKPELVAIRAADNRIIRVAQMSDGTADQLFLAVRLAWLDEYLDSHAAIPFIVDDILIRFDDERSAATLQLLAELSRRTQVILFTHHRHVVDIAQKTLVGDTLFVHELPTVSTAQPTLAG